tara:strand:- start:35253 stop:35549 length:297 start_codon:yes stop_codon:yes gene_type:complete
MLVKKPIVIGVTLINIYSFVGWIYFFNTFDTHEERVAHYINSWLVFSSVHQITWFLLVLTAISIGLLIRNANNWKNSFVSVFLVFQIACIVLMGWGYL